jgi:glycerol-3-phosphate acyltransferase PlsY
VIKTYIIVALVSYLLGSIPFGYILVKLFLKQDIRATGSGNIGATNVARSGAKGLAIATLLLDAGKGFLAVALTLMLSIYAIAHSADEEAAAAYALCAFAALWAVLGHMFPFWLRFRGGKGVATAVGAFSLLAPRAVAVALVIFVLTVIVTRYVSLGSMLAALSFPITAYFYRAGLGDPQKLAPSFYVYILITSLLVILKHNENVQRLFSGTENKLGGKKSVPPPDAVEKQA